MKHIFALSLAVLLGAGCFSPAPTPTPPVAAPEVPTGSPPAVVMTVGEETYPGVEGSYCYEGLCVDKVGPGTLVASAGLAFKDIEAGSEVAFSVGGEVFEFHVSIFDEPDLIVPVSFRDGRYTIKMPDVRGEHYLTAFVRFSNNGQPSGDVSYDFPVRVE